MKRIAIMQPYIFPYIGYFQLIDKVDNFIIYDDVNFIKQGWINRNNILVNNKSFMFTIPLSKPSPYKIIKDIQVIANSEWQNKFFRTLEMNYKKSPNYEVVFKIISERINGFTGNISELATLSIVMVIEYLGMNVNLIHTSSIYNNNHLSGQNRVIDICMQEMGRQYINPSGGIDLYSRDDFKNAGIELKFIMPESVPYKQNGKEFVPWLSIIDVLMYNDIEDVKSMIKRGELI